MQTDRPATLEHGVIVHMIDRAKGDVAAVRITERLSGSLFRVERVEDGRDLGIVGRLAFVECRLPRHRKERPEEALRRLLGAIMSADAELAASAFDYRTHPDFEDLRAAIKSAREYLGTN